MSKFLVINKCEECKYRAEIQAPGFSQVFCTYYGNPTVYGFQKDKYREIIVKNTIPGWCPLSDVL